MTARREGIRWSIYLVILVAATTWVFGCGHSNLGSWDDPDDGGGATPGMLGVPEAVAVSLMEIRLHDFVLSFASIMQTDSVAVTVKDDLGNDALPQLRWMDNRMAVHVAGPFRSCRTYTLTVKSGAMDEFGNVLEEDVLFEVATGPDPNDIDKANCTADLVFSRIFADTLDAAILPGSIEMERPGTTLLDSADLASGQLWYREDDGNFTDAGPMVLLPDLAGNNAVGAARLGWDERMSGGVLAFTRYKLELWGSCAPGTDTAPTSMLYYDIAGSSSERLTGPYNAGDLNGDGTREVMLSAEVGGSTTRLQRVFLLSPASLQPGYGYPLAEASLFTGLAGDTGAVLSPFVSVGDLDGDGFDDLAATRHVVDGSNRTSGWKIWLAHGGEDLPAIFRSSEMEVLHAGAGRDVVALDAADLNGDGRDDLIVAELQRNYVQGVLKYTNPRVAIILGSENREKFEGLQVDSADTLIRVYSPYLATTDTLSVRAIGDVNGDGLQDLAVGATARGYSAAYIVLGREIWYQNLMLSDSYTSSSAIFLEGDSKKEIVVRDDFFDPRVGDVNNDGYSDFMVKSSGVNGDAYHLFLGALSLGDALNQQVQPDDASASWRFIAP